MTAKQPLQEGYRKTENGEWEVVANHELEGVAPEMRGDAQGNLMHEYQKASFGTRMRSHFQLAPQTPEEIVNALYEHNKQECNFSRHSCLISILPRSEGDRGVRNRAKFPFRKKYQGVRGTLPLYELRKGA